MEQMEAIGIVLSADRQTSHLVPTWQDCDVLSSIVAALKPLKEMTDALSGEISPHQQYYPLFPTYQPFLIAMKRKQDLPKK